METLAGSANGVIPEAIIIGVSSKDRYRDFTPPTTKGWEVPGFIKQVGGAKQFGDYLVDEVIPFIDKNYRTVSNRTIIGHSLGGLFSLEVFLNHAQYFFGYIVLDPSIFWNNGTIVESLTAAIPKLKSEERIFMAAGLAPEGIEIILEPNQKRLEDFFLRVTNPNFIYAYKGLRGESHNEMPYQGVYLGLKAIFSDYEPDMPWKLSNEQIVDYYKKISIKYGYDVAIPIKLMSKVGGRN
jgi:uncharacterized protein